MLHFLLHVMQAFIELSTNVFDLINYQLGLFLAISMWQKNALRA